MVYQFLFDVFLFNTNFSELQYWGIGITVLTFALDIYLTINPAHMPKNSEEKGEDNQSDEHLGENELADINHNRLASRMLLSERAGQIDVSSERNLNTKKINNSRDPESYRAPSLLESTLSTQVSYKF